MNNAYFADGLPVTQTHYHGFWRTPQWRWWRLLLAVGIATLLYFGANHFFASVGADVLLAQHENDVKRGATEIKMTPALFIINNLSLISLIPIAWLTSLVLGQSWGWVSSVVGKFRWRWFFRCLGWAFLVISIVTVASMFVTPQNGPAASMGVNSQTGFMLLAILLTTPLQCVGEEFFCRGLINRAVSSLFPQRTHILTICSALAGGIVSSLFFVSIHSANNIWLNIGYFAFAATSCYLAWRSGGLEASCAMHIINNVIAMAGLPFTDFSNMFNRGAGSGSYSQLVSEFIMYGLIIVVLTRQIKRRRIAATSAPGAQSITDKQE